MSWPQQLLAWYRKNGRASLPWRAARDPYYTLVSEFMLQQTQVDRVVPAFTSFVARFPDLASLARARSDEVLRAWKGLGYNVRATRLKRVAETAMDRHGGTLPSETAALLELPGVGPYTAAAIRAFAFDIDDAPVDTNVRRIVHRLYYGVEYPPKASLREIDRKAAALVPRGESHDWSSALMDLGSTLCTARAPKCERCPVKDECRSAPVDGTALERLRRKHVRPRSAQKAVPFERTARYARGRIVDRLRDLPLGERISLLDLHASLLPSLPGRTPQEVDRLLDALERDGLIARRAGFVALGEEV